jgi:hypothetical protein
MEKNTAFIETRKIEWSPGFIYTSWTLFVNGKQFLLGQDGKWTIRVLGWDINDFFKEVGCDDRTPEGREKIGNWIVDKLNLTPKVVDELEPWGLCCQ